MSSQRMMWHGQGRHFAVAGLATAALVARATAQGAATTALAGKAAFLAETPTEIKTQTQHELIFFAHWKANNYANTTPLAPYSQADAAKPLAYQHAHCGITGP